MNEKINKKTSGKIQRIFMFSMLGLGIGFGVCNACIEYSTTCTVVKAEEPPYYHKCYVLKSNAPSTTYTFDEDNGTYKDYCYIDGKLYTNVDRFTLGLSVGNVTLSYLEGNTSKREVINMIGRDFIYYPYYDVDILSSTYFDSYDSANTNFTWLNNPIFNNYFGDSAIIHTNGYDFLTYHDGYIKIFDGYFRSGSVAYKGIEIHLNKLDGHNFIGGLQVDNSHNVSLRNYTYVDSVFYTNLDGTKKLVAMSTFEYGTSNIIPGQYTWLQETYKSLTIYGTRSQVYPSNLPLTPLEMLDYMNKGFYTDVKDNELENVFNIFSLLFASILPLFSLNLTATLTLGTLILIPLVLGVCVAIFKIIKR